jgi:hypothetical protein
MRHRHDLDEIARGARHRLQGFGESRVADFEPTAKQALNIPARHRTTVVTFAANKPQDGDLFAGQEPGAQVVIKRHPDLVMNRIKELEKIGLINLAI